MASSSLINRAGARSVALETTLLVHGVPPDQSATLAHALSEAVRDAGADPAIVGVVRGTPIVGMTDEELAELLGARDTPTGAAKANTANLGALMCCGASAATTVSATMELAAACGVRVFATGGIGGVHKEFASRLDISADLAALARFPVAVVTSGVKSLLNVEATREALETLGIPVVGVATDRFPAFYLRESAAGVDVRFDAIEELAGFVASELARTKRGIVIAHPIPKSDEIDAEMFGRWLFEAERDAADAGVRGRDVTPCVLARLHERSQGATLRANSALVKANATLAGMLAASMPDPDC